MIVENAVKADEEKARKKPMMKHYIIVKFTNESVVAYIKMKNQQEHVFVWDYIFLGTNLILPSKNKIKLYDEFVEESVTSLSKCPKVKIQNFYTCK